MLGLGNKRGKAIFGTHIADAMQANVMIADNDLVIRYINDSLVELLRRFEPELKAALPQFDVDTLIGRNLDIFNQDPSLQRGMLATLQKPLTTTIWVGRRAFDMRVAPLAKGRRHQGFLVEWADAKSRLLNLDFAAQIAAISRSQAIIAFGIDGTILNANERFLHSMGYRIEEIKGKHHSIFLEKAYRESQAYRDFWQALGRGEHQIGDYRRVSKDGRELWIQGSYNPILDANGKVSKVVKFAHDITHRVKSVNAIGEGLSALAEGRLNHRIDVELVAELDKLRVDFNRALEQLQGTMRQVGESSRTIQGGTEEIRASSSDLSSRTERQAATLEETAATLDEITATVRKTSEGALHARKVVETAKQDAESSATIVRQAVDAMHSIETSSTQISQIIGVIDEIAFQTNLLALNAGVEAARAGDAGRGFAVVASEVRGLAHRSAEAAKEIKVLISTSGQQVVKGVQLVGETGKALERIVTQVATINSVVFSIAASTQEQASSLAEVNSAVNQMDQVTQQNAAMVEQSTAASHTLAQETGELARLVGNFHLGEEAPPRRPARPSPRLAVVSNSMN